ncbi:tetratricopeptide repeat protein [Longimicrobium sp.]|uniref:tetratricopeptide repeat protein n=1 Tax=Longimicrobium sp. TaxID=2029185 RepID=UPI002E315797|nr:tetratricopeptide repeat protein [Longimicrobium sp.]HEX6038108.1 tetratricopeptide repeat protein [Longimicrobium sp.]
MADLSPEFATEIQKLEANYASNPGRFFLPLASKWRDAGDVAQAEAILRENLKRFPGLSAHVLLGRCLADRGAFQEAANEFHYVLSIDSQNQVALRILAEMAAAGGKRAEAERWYNELLAVDPMSAEARAGLAQLARAGAAPADEPAAPQWGDVAADTPVGGASSAQTDDGGFGMIDLDVPDASPADASGVAADDAADAGLGTWGDLTLDATPAPEPTAASVPSTESADGGDFDAFGFGSVDLDAEPSAEADASASWMDADARQDVGESAAADLGDLPLLDDGMIDAPLAGADLPFIDADATIDDGGLVNEPGAGFGFGEPAPAAADEGHVVHEADGHDADAEMVTETMAELYASQGLLAQAADVYRELIGQRGEEPGLVRRLAEIEARMSGAPESATADDESADTPDWLASVDAFSRGSSASDAIDAGSSDFGAADDLPLLDLDHAASDFGGTTDFGGETDAAELSIAEPAPAAFPTLETEPALDAQPASVDPFADSFAAGFDGAAVTADAGSTDFGTEPVASADFGSTDFSAEPVASADVGSADFGSSVSADAGSADAGVADDRQVWEAPTVAETEPVGFDILVVADEEGAQVPAPPEVVADVSADWAIAAAPLDDDEEEAQAEMAAAQAAYVPPAPGSRTMRGYFSSLLAWQPGAADAPSYEVSADESGALTIEAAAPDVPVIEETPSAAPSLVDDAPAPWEAAASDAPSFPSAPGIPTFEAPSLQPPAFAEPEAPVSDEAEPWAAAPEDEPWAAGESAPQPAEASAPGDLPLLDLEEPWAETPAAPAQPVDIASFELAEDGAPSAEPASAGTDAQAEELLPWEVPAEPAAANAPEAPAVSDAGGGFSFEDFFSGSSSAPAAAEPEPQPEPELPAPPVAEAPAFIPSFAEPTPPPVFEAPAPAPAAPAAPAPQAGGPEEDDEDLESFQAWLQSLKR